MAILATIITIGDEILIGQTIDTNSAWLGEKLAGMGIQVHRIVSISDQPDEIVLAIDEARATSRLIILTGGLGPTKDDRTKQTLAKYFHDTLVKNEEVLDNIKNLFKDRDIPINQTNFDQALVPSGCKVILNPNGTAPGMWWEMEGQIVISLPGVPYEMIGLMESSILNLLKTYFNPPVILHKTLMTTGVGESHLAAMIQDIEENLPKSVSLAYLPSPGLVRLRLSTSGSNRIELEKMLNEISSRIQDKIPDVVYGFNGISMQEVVGSILKESGKTLSIAESCTGGYISHLITSVPGSSAYFRGSMVLYENGIKRSQLGVSQKILLERGAVSREVVESMANSIRLKFKTDYSIAASGIAGPTGAVPGKPVGYVWVAVSGKKGLVSKSFLMGDHRERTITKSALAALNMLRLMVLNSLGSQ